MRPYLDSSVFHLFPQNFVGELELHQLVLILPRFLHCARLPWPPCCESLFEHDPVGQFLCREVAEPFIGVLSYLDIELEAADCDSFIAIEVDSLKNSEEVMWALSGICVARETLQFFHHEGFVSGAGWQWGCGSDSRYLNGGYR